MSERRYKNPQVNLRLPEELKEHIALMAERNKRSANAEMVAAIEAWVNADKDPYPQAEDATLIMKKSELRELIDEVLESSMKEVLAEYDLKSMKKKPT
ncbi:Arc family DNA-binding protein [Pantoea sp. ACRSB]|uniref:Arc family DNA-binding protein n=1 Tax=Pantoea sp. ACRSB TaxID=2918207 RepID=UPI002892A882|nr:Arc family DNA-binding protein [Pantoea sp. ACRSB]MCG7388290.1 Arc family DNA-binding protein [Pantoea sp. ACRSB]